MIRAIHFIREPRSESWLFGALSKRDWCALCASFRFRVFHLACTVRPMVFRDGHGDGSRYGESARQDRQDSDYLEHLVRGSLCLHTVHRSVDYLRNNNHIRCQ